MAITKVSRDLLNTSIVDNGNATAITIDSSENVGIGTGSPAEKLHVAGAIATTSGITGHGANRATFSQEGAGGAYIQSYGANTSTMGAFVFRQASSDFSVTNSAMTIDSSGNVGIGTSSPTSYAGQTNLNINSTGVSRIDFDISDALQGYVVAESGYTALFAYTGNYLAFGSNNTERMRINSDGDLLVGTTTSVSTSSSQVGGEIRSNGIAVSAVNSNPCTIANRIGTDGDITLFRKDGANIGSIGVAAGQLTIGTGITTLKYVDSLDTIHPNGTGSGSDGNTSLGWSNNRFNDIYATNGTINTSDRNEKQDIAELSDAEQRVAVAAKGLLRKFRWKDSVAEKGDDARIHFGIIAQDLQAAFAAEGLDAGDYAMFISTTWTDEETNEEKTRMGVRYSELLAFIIAAI